MSSSPMPSFCYRRHKGVYSKIIGITTFAILFAVAQYLYRKHELNYQAVLTYINLHHVLAPIIYMAIYAAFVILLIPTLPFNLGAGVLFGAFWGGVITIISTTLGASIAFLISRSIFAESIRQYFGGEAVAWLDAKVEKSGWLIIAFVRLCSALPTGPFNYILGLTKMNLSTYIFGTTIFLFIPSLIISTIGHQLGSTVFDNNATHQMIQKTMLELTVLSLILFLLPVLGRKFIAMRDTFNAMEKL